MKFEECKVGARVRLKSGVVETITSKNKTDHWTPRAKEFRIMRLNYIAKTVMIRPTDLSILDCYDFVNPACLTPAHSDKFSMSDALHGKIITPPQTPIEQPVDFKVISSPSQLSAYYKGKKIAVVDHNNYDEEFELNLLLRRACLKLKGEHTVVKTVEDLLQKP